MRVIFYSTSCEFSIKLLEYIDKNNLLDFFKLICIDELPEHKIPKNITIVPTLIDTSIEAPLEGKKAFEYVINQKYFNYPTNNVEYTKNGVPKPTIEEDTKANVSKSGTGFIYVNPDTESKFIEKDDKNNFDKVFGVKDVKSNNQVGQTQQIQKPTQQIQKPIQPIQKPIQKPIQQTQNNLQKTVPTQPQKEILRVETIATNNTPKDDKINQILTQRNNEDERLQKLMKLRTKM